MRLVGFTWLGAALLCMAPGELLAETSLDSRVRSLEETVRVLETRIASLEQQLRERSAAVPVASDQANWRRLRKGMSESEVEQLLGSPTKVNVSRVFTVWYYAGDRSRGEVRFDGETRTVDSWYEP